MTALSARVIDTLLVAGLHPADVERVVRAALDEDLRFGPDVTTEATVAGSAVATGDLVTRAPGVVAGLPVAFAVLDVVAGAACVIDVRRSDGERVDDGDVIATVSGPARAVLTAERTLLNLLTHLSGIATVTRAWVDAVSGTGVVVRDTRKTTPGLRLLEKYAVRCGGGANHRFGLGDAALIKDNHVAAAGGVSEAVRSLRRHAPGVPLQVECDTLDQLREALAAGVHRVLLDNMTIDELRHAVAVARASGPVEVEASGGLTLEGAREVAATGVDYLAVGSLTHSAPALDLGLDLRVQPVIESGSSPG